MAVHMKTNPCKKSKQQKCFISLPKFLSNSLNKVSELCCCHWLHLSWFCTAHSKFHWCQCKIIHLPCFKVPRRKLHYWHNNFNLAQAKCNHSYFPLCHWTGKQEVVKLYQLVFDCGREDNFRISKILSEQVKLICCYKCAFIIQSSFLKFTR